MVSKKKRSPPAVEASELQIPKKSKPAESTGKSSGSCVLSVPKGNKKGGGSNSKIKVKEEVELMEESDPIETDGCLSKQTVAGAVKPEKNEDENPSEHEAQERINSGGQDFPNWTQEELLELMKRIERNIPSDDQLRFKSRVNKLEWDSITFGKHSASECKETWVKIQNRLRRYRVLREILEDAKTWVTKPWTNFYRSNKTNRHPDMPRRPLSSYMIFYMAMKDRVAKEHPGLEMTEMSKYIADLYKSLPYHKKKKYADMAAAKRKVYEEKMNEFYQIHPELLRKQDKTEPRTAAPVGPKRPLPPFKLFCEDKMKRHINDPDFDRTTFLEKCKQQWKNMPDKKKVIWINWAYEEEARYTEQLKAFMSQNPEFVPSTVKTVLTKEEKSLRERIAGKPDKPPNSAYSLFSRIMLGSEDMKDFAPKERMTEISRMWKSLPESQKRKYQEEVNYRLDQYKLEYATYLESLPEDKRQEELQSVMPKSRKVVKSKATLPSEATKNAQTKANKLTKSDNSGLYKGEPEPPPRNEYQLFLKTLLQNKNRNYSEKDAPSLWQLLPDSDKAKYLKKLTEIKSKYIDDYEKFLNNLTQEELREYSDRKKKDKPDASDDSGKDEDSTSSDDDDDEEEEEEEEEEEDDDDEKDKESGSDDSSSDSESGSNDSDSSDSNDSKNSEESSSSASDSN